jgi:hypothetical protein
MGSHGNARRNSCYTGCGSVQFSIVKDAPVGHSLLKFINDNVNWGTSQWLRGQRRGSAAAGFSGLLVRIPPGGMDFVVLRMMACRQVVVPASGWSVVQRSPTERGVCECGVWVWTWSLDNGEALANWRLSCHNEKEYALMRCLSLLRNLTTKSPSKATPVRRRPWRSMH